MYIQMTEVRVMDPHRNEICPSVFIWIKYRGSFLFPHYSNPVFTRVFHGVTSSVGCKTERKLRSNTVRKHCIKRLNNLLYCVNFQSL